MKDTEAPPEQQEDDYARYEHIPEELIGNTLEISVTNGFDQLVADAEVFADLEGMEVTQDEDGSVHIYIPSLSDDVVNDLFEKHFTKDRPPLKALVGGKK